MYGRRKKRVRERLKRQFGENPLADSKVVWTRDRLDKIKIYHEEMRKAEHGEKEQRNYIDAITWNDLEMDEVFLRINNTKSFLGEQVLYHRLHDLGWNVEWKKWEQMVELFSKEELRLDVEERLAAIGKQEEHYYLPTFLMNTENWKVENGWILHGLQALLVMFLLGALVWDNAFCMAGLMAVAIVNLMIYLYMKQRYEVYLFSLGSLKSLINFCRWVTADEKRKSQFASSEVEAAVFELEKLGKWIFNWQNRKYTGMSGDLMYLLNDYLMGITLLDVAVFNHIMKGIYQKKDKVMLLYEFAGKMDMLISVASFRESLGVWCEPEIEEFWKKEKAAEDGVVRGRKDFMTAETAKNCAGNNRRISGVGIIHPLLEQPVANDFSLERRALITGANASGKSTFMKAVAINVILAQTIHTCVAKKFHLPQMSVMTSMALRDDILTGESYYVREVKYLKRMLDEQLVIQKRSVLYVIDEMLKGTNTKERLAASEAILEYLAKTDCFVLLATHDMELVYHLQGKYESYYFESKITEADILFDYQIQKGIGGASNAIALLGLYEFPTEVIEAAKKLIDQTGARLYV